MGNWDTLADALAKGAPTLLGTIAGSAGTLLTQMLTGRRDAGSKKEQRQAELLDKRREAASDLTVAVVAASRTIQADRAAAGYALWGPKPEHYAEVDRATGRLGMLSDRKTRDAANELVKALVSYVDSGFREDMFPAIGAAEDRLIVEVNRVQKPGS